MFSIGETSRPLGIDSPLNLKTITSKEEEEDEESEPKKLYTIFSEDDDHSEQESLKNNPKYNHKTSNDPNLDQLSNQLKVSDSDLGSDIISSLGQKQSSTSDESTAEDLANRRFFDSVFENLWNMDSTSKLLFSRCKNEASLMVDEPTSFQAKMYKDQNNIKPENTARLHLSWTFVRFEKHYKIKGSDHNLYEFVFFKGRKVVEIATFDYSVFKKLKKILLKKCLLNCFEEEYEIIRHINDGSVSKIYQIQRKENLKEFAVKIIDKRVFSLDEDLYDKLYSEIKTLRCLNHENLVDFEAVHETKKRVMIVMELVSGPNLLLAHTLGNLLTEPQLKFIMKSALLALDFLHRKGIAHRDLKPDSFVLVKPGKPNLDNQLKLISYSDCYFFRAKRARLAKKAGTVGFVAPECFGIDYKNYMFINYGSSDIWSLGAVLYYLATKRFVFSVDSQMQLIEANVKGDVQLKHRHFLKLSLRMQKILTQMLSKDPSKRPSAEEILRLKMMKKVNLVYLKRLFGRRNSNDSKFNDDILSMQQERLGNFEILKEQKRHMGRLTEQNLGKEDQGPQGLPKPPKNQNHNKETKLTKHKIDFNQSSDPEMDPRERSIEINKTAPLALNLDPKSKNGKLGQIRLVNDDSSSIGFKEYNPEDLDLSHMDILVDEELNEPKILKMKSAIKFASFLDRDNKENPIVTLKQKQTTYKLSVPGISAEVLPLQGVEALDNNNKGSIEEKIGNGDKRDIDFEVQQQLRPSVRDEQSHEQAQFSGAQMRAQQLLPGRVEGSGMTTPEDISLSSNLSNGEVNFVSAQKSMFLKRGNEQVVGDGSGNNVLQMKSPHQKAVALAGQQKGRATKESSLQYSRGQGSEFKDDSLLLNRIRSPNESFKSFRSKPYFGESENQKETRLKK